jgi:hypothetical protein
MTEKDENKKWFITLNFPAKDNDFLRLFNNNNYESGQKINAELLKIYENSFKKISFNFNNTSTAFNESQNIARNLSDNLKKPIDKIHFNNIITFKKNFDNSEFQFLQPSTGSTASSIGATEKIIEPIILQPKSEATLPEALKLPESEVKLILERILKSDSDLAFNFPAYQLIFGLELFLRNIIHDRIFIPYEKSLSDRIDANILKRWESRKQKEESNPLLDGHYRLIDQSDFSDVRKILERDENRREFSDILNDRQFRNVISKLDELEPIRNKIAHSRPLTKREFDKLKIYVDDIIRMFKK